MHLILSFLSKKFLQIKFELKIEKKNRRKKGSESIFPFCQQYFVRKVKYMDKNDAFEQKSLGNF